MNPIDPPQLRIRWPRGMDTRRFLQRHWQKAPLLVRGAFPEFRDRLPRSRLAALAGRDDVESRLVWRRRSRGGERFQVAHGPQDARALARLEAPDATLLVQGVDLHVAHTQPVMAAFDFIPRARRDDLMVSDASPGGGVGAHVDSYDVFLLQARGRRLWRIARDFDDTLVEDAPLRLLANFRAEDEYLLEPGDFLYLPPGVAHDGIALDECATWSIGFRAPSARELAQGWLAFLEDRFDRDARYADPDLRAQPRAAWISDAMAERARSLVGDLAFDRDRFDTFLGVFLTEPKPIVRFRAPARPLDEQAFAARAALRGLVLEPATRMLHRGRQVFINGEACALPSRVMPVATMLAEQRALPPSTRLPATLLEPLYDWYCSGYLRLR